MGLRCRCVGSDGKATLNTPEAKQALETFLAMKQYAPRGVDVYNADEVRDSLQKGTAAMAIEVWPAWVPNLDNPDMSDVVGDMEIMAPPARLVRLHLCWVSGNWPFRQIRTTKKKQKLPAVCNKSSYPESTSTGTRYAANT